MMLIDFISLCKIPFLGGKCCIKPRQPRRIEWLKWLTVKLRCTIVVVRSKGQAGRPSISHTVPYTICHKAKRSLWLRVCCQRIYKRNRGAAAHKPQEQNTSNYSHKLGYILHWLFAFNSYMCTSISIHFSQTEQQRKKRRWNRLWH